MTSLRVHVVTDDDALAGLAADWSRLLAETPLASGCQSLAWITACRRVLLGDPAALFTLVARDGPEVVGIVPTALRRGGDLRFIGDAVTNYLGPVYRPDRAREVVEAGADFLATDARVRLLDLRGLREGSPFLAMLCDQEIPGWSPTTQVKTAACPFVDLTPGWEALYARRKGKQRANFARKWAGLERLGAVRFVEIVDVAEVRPRLAALFALFAGRWRGRHESGGFAGRYRSFHERAITALADAGHLCLSVLELDGQVVAFSYGIRSDGVTSSYVLGHDDRLNVCSPGTLLLLRLLESAGRRGDREYDFSLGQETYKDQWATGTRGVVRLLRWRRGSVAAIGGRLRAAGHRAWVGARSVGWLRDLRREGLRSLVRPHTGPRRLLDSPGLGAGPGGVWHVHRVRAQPHPGAPIELHPWSYAEMCARLSPRLLDLAVDRTFRGDACLALHRNGELLGVVWRAGASRRALVTGGAVIPPDLPVYYHPLAAGAGHLPALLGALPGIDDSAEAVVITTDALTGPDAPVFTFVADQRFQTAPTPETA